MKNFNGTYKELLNESFYLDFIHKEEQLKDEWLTEQQASRDKKITKLLDLYVTAYENKVNSNPKYRLGIMIGCAVTIIAAIVGCTYITVNIIPMEEKSIGDIVALITAFGGVLGTLAGIVQIITKYVFPENEEQYITEIVKAIQTNDLENKKVNIYAESPFKKNKDSEEDKNDV